MIEKKLVMIPGPTPVVKSIQEQMGREVQAFGDPRFIRDYKQLIDDLAQLINCSGQVFPLAGTGTLGMEMAVANVTRRGDKILLVSHGFFGDRFVDICDRKGLQVDVLAAEWGSIIPVASIRAKLQQDKYTALIITHVDTATGVCAPIKEIGSMLKEFPEIIFIVDGVAATAGEYTDFDDMNIDILFTGSQKAFGVSPGMFILWASQKALVRRKSLGRIPEYYVDFEKWLPIMESPAKYFATPAINMVWALAESLRIIKAEGVRERYNRHVKNARGMQAALTALGFKVLAKEPHRAVTLSNLVYPEGLDDIKFRNTLYEEGMIVAGGLGPYAGKMFRLGHMGNIDINDEVAVLGIIERSLKRCEQKVEFGQGISVYLNIMTE